MTNKQPLQIIEGENIDRCRCGHKERYHSQDVNSQKYVCRGAYCDCLDFKGKSPTKLIFDAEEFKCEARKDNPPENWRCIDGDKCIGYLLPKKGDKLYSCECKEKGTILTSIEGHISHDFEPFCLSSDAVLKKSHKVPELYKIKTPDEIIICEGYYD